MPPNRRTRFVLPLLLAALTFALILLALWPNDPPTVAVLVASRDLGAGELQCLCRPCHARKTAAERHT